MRTTDEQLKHTTVFQKQNKNLSTQPTRSFIWLGHRKLEVEANSWIDSLCMKQSKVPVAKTGLALPPEMVKEILLRVSANQFQSLRAVYSS
jgi:hypothetical protein